MKKCEECYETFKWDDDVVSVNEEYYHARCVELVPTGYVAYVGDEFIGWVEYEDMACLVLDIDDYEGDGKDE